MDRQTDIMTDEQTDKRRDGKTDKRTNGWRDIDRQRDRSKHTQPFQNRIDTLMPHVPSLTAVQM